MHMARASSLIDGVNVASPARSARHLLDWCATFLMSASPACDACVIRLILCHSHPLLASRTAQCNPRGSRSLHCSVWWRASSPVPPPAVLCRRQQQPAPGAPAAVCRANRPLRVVACPTHGRGRSRKGHHHRHLRGTGVAVALWRERLSCCSAGGRGPVRPPPRPDARTHIRREPAVAAPWGGAASVTLHPFSRPPPPPSPLLVPPLRPLRRRPGPHLWPGHCGRGPAPGQALVRR